MSINTQQAELVDSDLWGQIWSGCRRRIRSWRVPPHWTMSQWLEELEAEGRVAALQALGDFDPGRNIPLAIYIRMRVLGQAIARYRKEWSYAIHQVSVEVRDADAPACVVVPIAVQQDELDYALAKLTDADRWLIDRLFWHRETETEVAHKLGVSQQAISKRKLAILRQLRHLLADRS